MEWLAGFAKLAFEAWVGSIVTSFSGGVAKKVRGFFASDPVEKGLTKAFRESWKKFEGSIQLVHELDASNLAILRERATDPDFLRIVGTLAHGGPSPDEVKRLTEICFVNGPAGPETADYAHAWTAFVHQYQRSVAAEPQVHAFVRQLRDQRVEKQLASIAEGQGSTAEDVSRVAELLELIVDRLVAEPARAPLEKQIDRHRTTLFERYRYADTRGLFLREREGVGEGIGIGSVFVETALGQRNDSQKAREKEEERSDAEREEAQDLAVRTGHDRNERIGAILQPGCVRVVLGSPGCGKSTLLRVVALSLCRTNEKPILELDVPQGTIPLLVELKRYATELAKSPNLSLLDFLQDCFKDCLEDLDTLLDEKETLVLLDGLDEVFVTELRLVVSSRVWDLHARFPKARIVVSSRPRGYEAAPLPGPAEKWEVQPFDDEQLAAFFRGWFTALAADDAEAGAREAPLERAHRLTDDVLSRPLIREMAKNPLLCTLIVLVNRSGSGRLPERRVRFYEAAVRTMIEHWERCKVTDFDPPEVADMPDAEETRRLLAEIAWRAFHELRAREIARKTLEQWIDQYLSRETRSADRMRRSRAVRNLLDLVRDRMGLLVDVGGDRFQFVHLSLHEYLVASFINTRLGEKKAIEVVRHYLHDPQWDEALLLAVDDDPESLSDSIVADLMQRPTCPELEPETLRDLRFLARAVGDLAPLSSRLQTGVLDRLQEAAEKNCTLKIQDWLRFGPVLTRLPEPPTIVQRSLGDLWRYEGRDSALEYYTTLRLADDSTRRIVQKGFGDNENTYLRESVVAYLTALRLSDWEARDLVHRALRDKNDSVRRSAVRYLTALRLDDEPARELVQRTLGDESPYMREAVLEYFTALHLSDTRTRELVQLALGDKSSDVRKAAIQYFTALGLDDEPTRKLVQSALRDEDYAVRTTTLRYFTVLQLDDGTTRELFHHALNDDAWHLRDLAIEYFKALRIVDASTRAIVHGALHDCAYVRNTALSYFTELRLADEATVERFRRALDDENAFLRVAALLYFGALRLVDKQTRELVQSAVQDEKIDVRRTAIEYYVALRLADGQTRELVQRALGDESDYVREGAVKYFTALCIANEPIRELILCALGDEKPGVRRMALKYFTALRLVEDQTRELVHRAFGDADSGVREAAIEYLTRCRLVDVQSRKLVQRALEDQKGHVQMAALQYFASTGFGGDKGVLGQLALAALCHSHFSRHDLNQELSVRLGTLASESPELLNKIRNEGSNYVYLDRSLALESAAREMDRRRREQIPLEVQLDA